MAKKRVTKKAPAKKRVAKKKPAKKTGGKAKVYDLGYRSGLRKFT